MPWCSTCSAARSCLAYRGPRRAPPRPKASPEDHRHSVGYLFTCVIDMSHVRRRMECGVPARKFIAGHRPLLAVGAPHYPVTVRRGRGALQGRNRFAGPCRPGENPSAPSPLPSADVLVGGLENIVAYRPTLTIGFDRSVSGVGPHRLSRPRRPPPGCAPLFGGDRPDPREGPPHRT